MKFKLDIEGKEFILRTNKANPPKKNDIVWAEDRETREFHKVELTDVHHINRQFVFTGRLHEM